MCAACARVGRVCGSSWRALALMHARATSNRVFHAAGLRRAQIAVNDDAVGHNVEVHGGSPDDEDLDGSTAARRSARPPRSMLATYRRLPRSAS